mgnify:CR=1 FL=1
MLAQMPQELESLIQRGLPETEDEAQEIAQILLQYGSEILALYLLALSENLQEKSIPPSTPSGMTPPYLKENKKEKDTQIKKKKTSNGQHRPKPEEIKRKEEHQLEHCPDCGNALNKMKGKHSVRTRYIEDLPPTIEPEITEHSIHRDYCPHCQKFVEPKIPDALPKSNIGNRAATLSACLHYELGMTGSQITSVFNDLFHFPITEGGLFKIWHKVSDILVPWYDQIGEEILQSAVLHGDESGWRVDGQTYWIWCFACSHSTYYMIDPSRGFDALSKFLHETFDGILVTDFLNVYDKIRCADRQYCIAHLLRELEKVNQSNLSDEWMDFSKKLKRLLQDAIRLKAREDFHPDQFTARIQRFHERLLDLAFGEYKDRDTKRLAKRLDKYWDGIFTFLEHMDVPATNNHVEREIRFAVLIRKITYGNRSEKGALTQSILMTIFRTLKRRGYHPVEVIESALREYILTGKLPPFPQPITSDE